METHRPNFAIRHSCHLRSGIVSLLTVILPGPSCQTINSGAVLKHIFSKRPIHLRPHRPPSPAESHNDKDCHMDFDFRPTSQLLFMIRVRGRCNPPPKPLFQLNLFLFRPMAYWHRVKRTILLCPPPWASRVSFSQEPRSNHIRYAAQQKKPGTLWEINLTAFFATKS